MQAEELGSPHLQIVPFTEDEAARIADVTAPATQFDAPEPLEARPGGATTRLGAPGRKAFMDPSANIGDDRKLDFVVGQSLFEKLWVAAPSATTASDGLGPLYNARLLQLPPGKRPGPSSRGLAGRPALDDPSHFGAR